jgi:hypothetical protein
MLNVMGIDTRGTRGSAAFSVACLYPSFKSNGNLGLFYPCGILYILQIQEAGFDILKNEERTMTEAEMRLFYQHRAREVSSSASVRPVLSLCFPPPALHL